MEPCAKLGNLSHKENLKVIDSCAFDFPYIDVTIHINVILLEDGSLWRWVPGWNWLVFLSCTLVALFIAIAASFLIRRKTTCPDVT